MRAALTNIALLLLVVLPASLLAQQTKPYKGMLLVEALEDLQVRGLRVVFSSAIVRLDFRVVTEPRATTPRQQLEEMLAPHGLAILEGPGQTLQIVRATAPPRERQEARGSLEGRVVDAWTAAPVPRVSIRVAGHSEDTVTDTRGQFAVVQLANGPQLLTASAVGYVPVRQTVVIDAGTMATVTVRLIPETRRYEEFISVTDAAPTRTDRGVASELSLGPADFQHLHGSVAEDPLRAVQAFPGVTPIDDFRSDFAVRGSPFRHVALVVDGIPTHWLRHTTFARGATGSLMMLSGLVVERATLRSGAYPRRHGDNLGSELDLSIRQGSRSELVIRAAVGGSHAVLTAEGPVGEPGPGGLARGSWLVSGRQSYLEWPPERTASSRTPFGFSDGLAKVVFDVRPTQQFTVTAIRGISSVDEEDDGRARTGQADGSNRATAISLSWRSTLAPAFVVRQQASVVSQAAGHGDREGLDREGRSNQATSYRVELSRPVAGGMLEAGGLVERLRTTQVSTGPLVSGSGWVRSGFAYFSRPVAPSLTLSPGIRVTWSTLTDTPIVSRWLLGEWSFRPRWTVIVSAGAARQLPDLRHVVREIGSPALRAERAMHVEFGIERQLTRGTRWQATLFGRREADVIRLPDLHPRLVANARVLAAPDEHSANVLEGTSRGIELLVSRRTPRGLSGWATYSYGRTRQRDAARAETFWADFDQRHTFSVSAQYRFSPITGLGATFRAGSNFPISGYFATHNGRLVVANVRNQVRMPPYARLDVRADRRFRYLRRPFTVFVEALNVLNRANVGLADGSVDPVTYHATGFTDTLLRRRLSAGVVFEF